MSAANDTRRRQAEYLLRLADDRLILGHRLSEWSGHGPILEEDVALANIALDLIGQAEMLLDLAAELEAKGRSADQLAYLREAEDFLNLTLVEVPNGDFADTIARQFLFDAYDYLLWQCLSSSALPGLADIAGKAVKESRYHLRHSRQWVLRLGDGTDLSKGRIQRAFNDLWTYTGEIFQADEMDRTMQETGVGPDLQTLQAKWRDLVEDTLREATLETPSNEQYMHSGSRQGQHSEHLGHLLCEMQILPRSYPDAVW